MPGVPPLIGAFEDGRDDPAVAKGFPAGAVKKLLAGQRRPGVNPTFFAKSVTGICMANDGAKPILEVNGMDGSHY